MINATNIARAVVFDVYRYIIAYSAVLEKKQFNLFKK